MHRRLLLGLMAAGTAAPRLLFAQAARMPTIAVLYIGEEEDEEIAARPFFETMGRLGWIDGKSITFDRHSGKGARPYLGTMVSNAAGAEPDLVFATTNTLALAVLKEKPSLPMVFVTMFDPVAAGLVASLKKPGGNATGAFQAQGDAAQKRFALVRQAMPELKRMGAVFDRNASDYQARRAAHEKYARGSGIQLVGMEFTNFEAIAKIFAQYRRDGIRVTEMTPSFALTGRRREVAQMAERNEIALVAHRAEWADAGAILTYGVDIGENYRRAAVLADRILKGARPGDLPVESPHRLELVVNTKAALAQGIALPKALLQQANRVIA
jgi:putative tryptophan/tyrosine transport system substrate-binding protein